MVEYTLDTPLLVREYMGPSEVLLHDQMSIVWCAFPAEQVYITATLRKAGIDTGVIHADMTVAEHTNIIQPLTWEL